MLKVLFLTSPISMSGRENVGDRVILAGTRNLIAAAFGHYVYREHGRWSRFEGSPDDFDLIVYAGMPQYGGRDKPNREEDYFAEIVAASKRAVFMNIGGGTIHALGLNTQFEAIKMARSGIGAYYSAQEKRVAYRTVRDLTSKLFFDRIGVKAELRPCPSYYATQTIQPGAQRPGAIAALNNKTFVTNRFKGDIGELMARLHDRHPDFDLISHSGSDLALIADMGRQHLFFRTEMGLLSYYTTMKRLAALRVHGAIPAWTLGANVVVGGFDNRVGMFDDVGMPIPWVNMLIESIDSLVDQIDTLMMDDASHAPLEVRRELIQTQLRRAAGEVRASAPDLVERASAVPVSAEGWLSHPPAGTVHAIEGGFRLTPVSLDLPVGDEQSDCVVVSVPAGVRAPAAGKALEFPVEVEGRKFQSRVGSVEGARVVGGLKGANGDFAFGHSIFLPNGDFSCLARIAFAPGAAAGRKGRIELIVRQNGLELGRRVLDAGVLAEKGKLPASASVKFTNLYAAQPLEFVLRVSGFAGTETLTLKGVAFSRAELA